MSPACRLHLQNSGFYSLGGRVFMRRAFLVFRRVFLCSMLLVGLVAVVHGPAAAAESCEAVAKAMNARLSPKIDERELSDVLVMLNTTKNRDLPAKFVTKKQARNAGWNPGRDLWSVKALHGKSIGGDTFGNFERRLPKGKWREADLDYKGGKRGAKRIVFSQDGRSMVTVDHYQTFTEVPECR